MHDHDSDQWPSRRDVLRRSAAGVGALAAAGLMRPAAVYGAAAPSSATTPEEALARLHDGNARFASGQPINPQRDLGRLREVAAGQSPFAAFLGCADSRVPIELAYDQGFGDLFVVRVAGNIATAMEIASLEFGTHVLGASVIVVLGHSGCGAVKAALAGSEVPGQISALYSHIVPALDRKRMDLAAATAANVRYQARKLKASPVIRKRVADGQLRVVGGVFDIATARVTPVEL